MAKEHAGLGVKARDGCHLAVGEPEIEDVQVFFHALLVRGLGQSDDVALSEPTQDHLRDGLAMYLANLGQGGIGEHVLHALPERSPCFLSHAPLDHVLASFDLLVERISLDLIDHRGDLIEGDHIGQTIRIEVTHADGADHAVLVELFECTPRAVGIGKRLVQ